MIWAFEMCTEVRARLAAEDYDYDAFDPEVVARIERATGRAFGFDNVSGTEVFS